jgi:hypothetical protein
MIAFNRTASIAPGKMGAAMAFAHEIATYLKTAHGIDLEVMIPIGGNPNRIGWTTRYQDLAALDVMNTKMLTDKKYMELVSKNSDNFIPGSVHDSMWRKV